MSDETENASSKERKKEKHMVIYAKVQMTGGIGHRYLTVLLYHHQQQRAPLARGGSETLEKKGK